MVELPIDSHKKLALRLLIIMLLKVDCSLLIPCKYSTVLYKVYFPVPKSMAKPNSKDANLASSFGFHPRWSFCDSVVSYLLGPLLLFCLLQFRP
jgi:hypothetical protein